MNSFDFWIYFGFVGQMLFGSRFFIQWIASERRKESFIPISFWYFSIGGSAFLLCYAIHRRDPVFVFGQCTGLFIYLRNLSLIFKNTKVDIS